MLNKINLFSNGIDLFQNNIIPAGTFRKIARVGLGALGIYAAIQARKYFQNTDNFINSVESIGEYLPTLVIKTHIAAGVDINLRKDYESMSALMRLARHNHIEGVRALINAGANINDEAYLPLFYGQTNALLLAAGRGHAQVVQALIDAGADLNAKSNFDFTALMFAAMRGHAQVVRALIDAEADLNAKSNKGCTALMFAAERGHAQVVQALIDAGADTNIEDKKGRKAETLANDNNIKTVIRRDHNARIRQQIGEQIGECLIPDLQKIVLEYL